MEKAAVRAAKSSKCHEALLGVGSARKRRLQLVTVGVVIRGIVYLLGGERVRNKNEEERHEA